jgi:TPR repeat protein
MQAMNVRENCCVAQEVLCSVIRAKSLIFCFLLPALLTACISVAVYAGPLEDAQAAYARKDYARAIEIWAPLAEDGDAAAQVNLGSMYAMGQGVTQNLEVAYRLFESSANQGNSSAQLALADCYANGRGVARNFEAAKKWFERSANQGNPTAQYSLGSLMLSMKPPVRDPVLAYKWLEIAATNRSSPAYIQRFASSIREKLVTEMDPAQLAEAKEMVVKWKRVNPTSE